MHLLNIRDVDAFFKVIEQCKGTVELITDEGDRLNLKSKLSQYLIVADAFSHGKIDNIQIVAHEKEDSDRIYEYLINEA